MASGPFLHQGAWRTSVTANDSTQQEELGAIRYEGAKIYKYVRASSAATIAQYSALTYSDNTGYTVKICPVGSSTTGQAVNGVAETALSTSYYGWMTVYGPTTALVEASAATGAVLAAVSTAGMLVAPSNNTGGAQSNRVAQALVTGVATGSLVFLQCL